MNAERFDAITRALPAASRRQVLRGLLGAVLGGLFAARGHAARSRAAQDQPGALGTASGSLVAWPFREGDGGQWGIVSGYGQGDHRGGSRYGLDFARCTGTIDPTARTCDDFDLPQTRGATVYAPVSGTVAWGDDGCFGLAIDIADRPGYRLGLFHIDKDSSLPGTTWRRLAAWRDAQGNPYHVEQGQPIGTVSAGYCCTGDCAGITGDHIHMHLYTWTGDDRSSNRSAVAFAGDWSIDDCPYSAGSDYGADLVPCGAAAIVPGGLWISPDDGETATAPRVRFAAHAYPTNPGDPAIERVEFTLWWPGYGPRDGPWKRGCTAPPPRDGDVYACEVDLARLNAPNGQITISFDVYDEAGNSNLAPHGLRTLTWRRDAGCPSGQTRCGGSCVNLRTNAGHCGECGNRCGIFQICCDGECGCDGTVFVPGWCMGADLIC